MHVEKYEDVTIVTAEKGKFLKLKSLENSEEIIGRPLRIIFDNSKEIPKFEEVNI